MEKLNQHSCDDFVLNDDFVEWTLRPTPELEQYWKQYFFDHQEENSEAKKAIMILKALIPLEEDVSDARIRAIWLHLQQTHPEGKRRIIHNVMKVAAMLILAIGIAGIAYYQFHQNKFPTELIGMDSSKIGRVILPDGSIHYFKSEQNTLQQLSSGKLALNQDTLELKKQVVHSVSGGNNSVIVPFGQRIQIKLQDGTHVWLNSGSRFSYPSNFSSGSREVYLVGEAYFEVSKNPHKPFRVITPEIKVTVTGTHFNLSSYEDDKTAQTVLVEGRVNVERNKLFAKSLTLSPGEGALFNKDNRTFVRNKVNTEFYTSWVNGYLLFHEESVTGLLKKLSRYYNRTIIGSEDIRGLSCSGKLDLKENIESVIQEVAFASSLKYSCKDGKYYVRR